MAMFLVFVGLAGVLLDLPASEIVSSQVGCVIAYWGGILIRAWWGSAREAWRPDR